MTAAPQPKVVVATRSYDLARTGWNQKNFKRADFGAVLTSGYGEPTDKIREKTKREFGMVDFPPPPRIRLVSSGPPDGGRET